jgi:hypothetical protein
MTSTLESPTRPPDGTPPGTPQQTAPNKLPRKHSAGHIVAIVIGCLMLLPGLGLLAGGGALAIAQAAATDDDGYFRFTLDRVESDGVAVATTDLWLEDVDQDAGPWVFDFLDLDVRLRVEGAGTSDDVFVGIARSADVERYLSKTSYSEIVEIDHHTPRYRQISGIVSIDAPADQEFWTASAVGSGEQELTWAARGGRWSVVVMNADGSPDLSADIEIGARSDAVTPIAITLLVIGTLTTGSAIVLIVVGARGRRRLDTSPDRRASRTPFPPPPPHSVVQPDDQRDHPTSID